MATSNNANKCTTQKSPKMLKEFLQVITNNPSTLPRSRSRSRATVEAAITSFQKLLNVFKSLHHRSTSSPPLTLPRSLSRTLVHKFSIKKRSKSNEATMINKVKVKDILGWRSFRDNDNTVSQTTNNDTLFWENASANTISTTLSQSRGDCSLGLELISVEKSDCYSTMDELPCWWGNFIEDKNNDVVATVCDVGPKEDNNNNNNNNIGMEDEKEQHSPISVLDSPFREETTDQVFKSSFDISLANMERTKQSLLQSIQWLESLAGVYGEDDDTELEEDEQRKENNAIKSKRKGKGRAISKLIKEGQSFEDKEVCIKDMDKQEQWSKFEEDKLELGIELESQLLCDLVNEVLADL